MRAVAKAGGLDKRCLEREVEDQLARKAKESGQRRSEQPPEAATNAEVDDGADH